MDEIRRQAYLQAMGIDTYFHPPPLSVARSTMTSVRKPRQDNPPGPGQNESKKSAGYPAAKGESSTTKISGAQSSDENSTLDELRFCLQFYQINKQVAVINEIPYLDNGRVDQSVRALLLAILKALEVELELLQEPQVFRWPLTADDDASAERLPVALLALEGFMRKRLESFCCSHLLVFAGQCGELLQNKEIRSQVFRDTTAQVTITQSLHAMLRVPVLKKQVWEDIGTLQGRLSDSLEAI